MQGRFGRAAVALAVAMLLAACSGSGDPRLMNARTDGTPDEFSILPTKPLQAPPDFATLPPPTPGGTNLTDPTPEADAVVAMGGSAAALARGHGGEAALLAHAGRYGTDPDIRRELADADLEWRRENDGRLLERIFAVNVYFKAYRAMELDQYAELARIRRLGLRNPSAPPDPADD